MDNSNRYVSESETEGNIIITFTDLELKWLENLAFVITGDTKYFDCGQNNRLLISDQMFIGKKAEAAFFRHKGKIIYSIQRGLEGNYKWIPDYKEGTIDVSIKSKSKEMERKWGTSFIIQAGSQRRDKQMLEPADNLYISLITESETDKNAMVIRAIFPAKMLVEHNLYHFGEKQDKAIIYMREIIEKFNTNNLFIRRSYK